MAKTGPYRIDWTLLTSSPDAKLCRRGFSISAASYSMICRVSDIPILGEKVKVGMQIGSPPYMFTATELQEI